MKEGIDSKMLAFILLDAFAENWKFDDSLLDLGIEITNGFDNYTYLNVALSLLGIPEDTTVELGLDNPKYYCRRDIWYDFIADYYIEKKCNIGKIKFMEILINQDSNAACDLFNSIREEK